jgi:hypothetical protein
MSDSSPLRAPSLQLASVHTPALHTLLAQSLGVEQGDPGGQPGQSPPPQSASSSLPLRVPSWQEASVHRCVVGAQNRSLAQSASRTHVAPEGHAVGQSPPQSTADSPPFRTPSAHAAAAHWLASQRKDAQSRSIVHALPVPQGSGHVSPQSMAGSRPFWMPSLHVGTDPGQFGPGHSGTSQELGSSSGEHAASQVPRAHTSPALQSLAALQQLGPVQMPPEVPAAPLTPEPASLPTFDTTVGS